MTAFEKCPLEYALKSYTVWAQSTSTTKLLNEENYKTFREDFHHSQKGQLTPSQEHRLMVVINRLIQPVNAFFNRQFTASLSPLVCGDAIGFMENKENAILLFERKVRDGNRLAMFGGIADAGEDVSVTARREFHEETGYGCQLSSQRLALVRDFTLGGPLPRISVTYLGSGSGKPVPNHEASSFKYFTPNEIQKLSEDDGFACHIPMIQKALELQESPLKDNSIYYDGLRFPLDDEAKSRIQTRINEQHTLAESPLVNSTIEKIDRVVQKFISSFKVWKKDYLRKNPSFIKSRDTVWSSKENETDEKTKRCYMAQHNWNDFSRLWDFLAPWQGRLLSTNPNADDLLHSINKIFETKIKIREAGTVELFTLLRTSDDLFIALKNQSGKFELLSVFQRYNENFQQALYREAYERFQWEIQNGSKLWDLSYDPNEKDDLGNEYRTFLMESCVESLKAEEVSFDSALTLNKEELIISLSDGKWELRHAKLLKSILLKKRILS